MKILLFKKLGIAWFADEGIAKYNGKISVVNENGDKQTVKVHYNDQIKEIHGESQIPSAFFSRRSEKMEISQGGKRYNVGEVMMTDLGIITRNTNAAATIMRLCQVCETALQEKAKIEKRIKKLEEAYYGSDITELK